MQRRRNSGELALELRLFWIKPSKWKRLPFIFLFSCLEVICVATHAFGQVFIDIRRKKNRIVGNSITPIDNTYHYSHITFQIQTLQWRQNGHDGVPNHQPHDCLLNPLVRHRSKKASKPRVLCEWNSTVTGEFPAQMAGSAENVSIWWRHHEYWNLHVAICYTDFEERTQYPVHINNDNYPYFISLSL